jgi:type IV pilus assembly protein PilM
MSTFSFLTKPRLPRNAFSLGGRQLAAVELRRRGTRFAIAGAAYEPIEPGLCTPSFDGRNIPRPEELAAAAFHTAEAAGLAGRQRWSVLLPEAAMRTLVVAFESVPATRAELAQIISWKTERMVGVPASDLRLAKQLVTAGGTPKFLVVAVRESVLAEYEALFGLLGWKVGLLAPRYVGEIAWLDWDATPGDKLLVGVREKNYTAAIVRGGELLLVRSLDPDPARFDDEVFRLASYYRDRIADGPEQAAISRVLLCGQIDGDRVSSTVGEALGIAPEIIHPVPDLLELDNPASFGPLAGAAGLATQAWGR